MTYKKTENAILESTAKTSGLIDEILKAGFFKASFFRPAFLNNANKYLAIILALLLIYLLADTVIFSPSAAVNGIISGLSKEKTDTRFPFSSTRGGETDYSYYSSVLSGKETFGRSVSVENGNAPENPLDIALVGVIVGARPQAIIENRNTRMVYYVRKGDKFENCAVEEVSAYKAVISCEGKKIELEL
jgi:type II secretory pathway component PulC